MRVLLILAAPFLFFKTANAQNKFKAYFKSDTVRLSSSSLTIIDTSVQIIVPKGQSLQKGKIVVSIDKKGSFIEQKAIKTQIDNEFKVGALEDTLRVEYTFNVPRDTKDDRFMRLELQAFDSLNKQVELEEGNTTTIIYIKPMIADSLTSNGRWEFWVFTGTNFDPFLGAKPQEFFFRGNILFNITKRFYGQLGFYKNRYFTADSAANIQVFYPNSPNRIIQGTDTSYSYTQGSYQRNTSQKVDPVGVQLDIFYKLTSERSNRASNFFATAGFDVSTKSIRLENKFTNIDTATILLKQPRTGTRGETFFPLPLRDEGVTFQLPVYNYNLGLLWILNEDDYNIKAHVTGGISSFLGARIFTPRGSTQPTVNYEKGKPEAYYQIRIFGTVTKYGISLGFDMFKRTSLFPQFNYTLSKVFDLRNFLNILTPVTALDPSKSK